MNENAKRREELLLQMRKEQHSSLGIPVVHPRYGRIYNDLYGHNQETTLSNHSLFFRLFVSVLCFLLYLAVSTSDAETAQIYHSKITSTIQKNYDYKEIQELFEF